MKLIYNKNTKSFSNIKLFANADRRSINRIETINEVLDEKNNHPDDWAKRQQRFDHDLSNTIRSLEESVERLTRHKKEMSDIDKWWNAQEDEMMDIYAKSPEMQEKLKPEELTRIINAGILDKYNRWKDQISELPKKKALLAKLKSNKIKLGDEIAGRGIAGNRWDLKSEGIVIGYEKGRGFIIDPYQGYGSWTVFIYPVGAIKLNDINNLEKEFNKINDSLSNYYVVSNKNGEYFITELKARNSYDVREQWKSKSDELGYIVADSRDSHKKGYYGITPFKEIAEETLEYYKSSK